VERSRILVVDIVDAAHDLRHLEYRTESTLSPSHSVLSSLLYYSVDQRALKRVTWLLPAWNQSEYVQNITD
jgi:hypothetical protein